MRCLTKALACCAMILPFSFLNGQIKPLVKVVGNHYSDGSGNDIAVLDDGTSVIVGKKHGSGYWSYAFMAMINADGTTRKEVNFQANQEGTMEWNEILIEPGTGCFYIGGTTMLRTGPYASFDGQNCKTDACLAKFDRNGNELWFQTIPWDEHQTFNGMGFTSNGNISVSFCDVVMAPIEDFMEQQGNVTLLKFNFADPDNNLLTQREFNCIFTPEGKALAVHEFFPPYEYRSEFSQYISAGDGTFWYFMEGFKRKKTEALASYPHLFRITENGEVLAEHLFTGATGEMMDDIMVLQNGNLLISVHQFGSGGDVGKSGAHLYCIDKNANILWSRYYYSDFEQPHIQSTQTPEGDVISVMYSPGNVAEFAGLPKSRCNMYITKISEDGKDIWKKTILGMAHYQGNEAIDYYNGEIRIVVNGANSTDHGLPPDHKVHYYSFKDF